MRDYEKIILALLFAGILLCFIDFHEKYFILSLLNVLVSISYFVEGNWLFNLEGKTKSLSIVAGIILSISSLVLGELLFLSNHTFIYLLISFNVVFFLVLLIVFLIKFNRYRHNSDFKKILLRSFVLFLLTMSLSYLPTRSSAFRSILMVLHRDNDEAFHNLAMHEYSSLSYASLENGAFDEAIYYAKKSRDAGKNWADLSIKEKDDEERLIFLLDSLPVDNRVWPKEFSPTRLTKNGAKKLSKLSGAYMDLSYAYAAKGHQLYRENAFKAAIAHYQIAYNCMSLVSQAMPFSASVEYSKCRRLNDLSASFMNIKYFNAADSIFVAGINSVSENFTVNELSFILYYNYGYSLHENGFTEESIDYLIQAEAIHNKLLAAGEDITFDLNQLYLILVNNLIGDGKLNLSIEYIQKGYQYQQENDFDEEVEYKLKVLNILADLRLNNFFRADSILESCDICKDKTGGDDYTDMKLISAMVKRALGEFQMAQEELALGKPNLHEIDDMYATYILLDAELDYATGRYRQASSKFKDVIQRRSSDELEPKRMPVYLELALVQQHLSQLDSAIFNANKALDYFTNYKDFPSSEESIMVKDYADILYNLGFVNKADSLYGKVIEINQNHGAKENLALAGAFEGCGLIALDKGDTSIADSLFRNAMNIYSNILPLNHYKIAYLYSKQAKLAIELDDFQTAEELLSKSLNIYYQSFDETHDTFGDIYAIYGDLNFRRNDFKTAENWYAKALENYNAKFQDKTHHTIVHINSRLAKVKSAM